jgi:Zn finger protein HypA/HybF involved in hydrogenase expression
MNYRTTETIPLDNGIKVCLEEQTLSDGSKAHNVVIVTRSGERVRLCMENARLAFDLECVLSRVLMGVVDVEIDPPDTLRCRYPDCQHPVALDDEQVTCPMCRDDLGLPSLD